MKLTSEITVRPVQQCGGDWMVVAAAKVSTSGEDALRWAHAPPEEGRGLIRYLMRHRHGTPFEHASLTFFVHAPIFVFREWHRHRVGHSYNETSGRYSKLEPVFWVPRPDRPITPAPDHKPARPKFVADAVLAGKVATHLTSAYREAWGVYECLLRAGIAPEVARACLPVGIYSSCWVTVNPRSLMAFLSLRTHEPGAKFVSYPQAEIEEAARACEMFFATGWPLTYAAWNEFGRVAP